MQTESQPLVSVIMPIYNAKDYVEKAIRSVCNQTYQNLEILLIVDGSTDGSGEICDRLSQTDERIKVIHQRNGGICKARNHGLNIASGRYVAFCDHDDEMLPRCIETAVSAAEQDQASLVKFVHRTERYVDGRLVHTGSQALPDAIVSMKELRNDYQLFNAVIRALWNGFYRMDIIRDYMVSFDEDVRYGMEDLLFNIELIRHISCVTFKSELGYIHYARMGQSTDEKFSTSKMDDCIKTAAIECNYFLAYSDFNEETWVWHQAWYLAKYVAMLFHPDNPMGFQEKCATLREINTPEKLGLQCSNRYVWRLLFESPRHIIRAWLFDMHMYGMLVVIDTINKKLQNSGLLSRTHANRDGGAEQPYS